MIITIIIAIAALSLLLLLMRLILGSLGRDANKIIKKYTDDTTEYFKEVKISFQSLDIEVNKNKFNSSKSQPDYSNIDCDLMLTSDKLIVIIKTKVFRKTRLVIPAIITGLHSEVRPAGYSKIVKCMDLREKGADLEIDFMNAPHKNLITITLPGVNDELKNKIKKVLQ